MRYLPFVAVAAAAGCGGDYRTVYPTRGTVVTADGQPAAGAAVVFHPKAKPDDNRHKPAGVAGADGTFVLTTYNTNDGAPAGEYAVTVEWRPAGKGPLAPPEPDRLGGKFRDPATSGLTATIEPKDNDLPPIRLP